MKLPPPRLMYILDLNSGAAPVYLDRVSPALFPPKAGEKFRINCINLQQPTQR